MLDFHGRFLCAISLSLLVAVAAARQSAPPGALPSELRLQLQNERFGIVTSIRGLPLGVRGALQTLFGSDSLDIAEAGARFQENERSVSSLPTRRLAAAGCSYEHCLVYYERGGTKRTWHVALFRWTPEETKFLWGGTAPAGLKTIDEVRSGILSGAIKGPGGSW